MWRILQRGIGAVAITASAQGVLLYLASKNIHPGQWIADTIGIAVSAVIANQIFSYALLSFVKPEISGPVTLLGFSVGD